MVVFLLMAFGLGAQAILSRCEVGAPQPLGFHARGFGYVAELFPPRSRHNPGPRPVAYFYEVGYPGTDWRVDARRLWTGELANPHMPQGALVSMAGHFVTLDDHHQTGGEHTLALYERDGRLIRSFALHQLLDPAELDRLPFSDCGRMWRSAGTEFYFTNPTNTSDAKLYVVMPWGRVLELTLATGALRRGTISDFATLRDITAREFPNEQAENWMLSLRFSSITDVLTRK